MRSLSCILLALGLLSACTAHKTASYGIQDSHASFVPARTAIFPCRIWPPAARSKAMPLSSASDATLQELCSKLDAFVVSAFDKQPYMKAFSPKFVTNALATGAVESLDTALPRLWNARDDGTTALQAAQGPSEIYRATIARREDWLAWLARASQAARNADAALMPFVTYADERRFEDRGLKVAERAAGVALLLVDTASGALIWAGGREAQVPVKRLGLGATAPEPPPWDIVLERLLTEDLWREYPGRQVF